MHAKRPPRPHLCAPTTAPSLATRRTSTRALSRKRLYRWLSASKAARRSPSKLLLPAASGGGDTAKAAIPLSLAGLLTPRDILNSFGAIGSECWERSSGKESAEQPGCAAGSEALFDHLQETRERRVGQAGRKKGLPWKKGFGGGSLCSRLCKAAGPAHLSASLIVLATSLVNSATGVCSLTKVPTACGQLCSIVLGRFSW